jgi:hypothetical protein
LKHIHTSAEGTQCCSGTVCANGKCCTPNSDLRRPIPCTADGECCSGICTPTSTPYLSICFSCRTGGDSCRTDAECCFGNCRADGTCPPL